MNNEKCPYAKYLAKDFDIHIDCLDCPSSVCNYPKIYDQFWEKWNKRSKFMSELREKEIVRLRQQGKTYEEIGKAFGISKQRASAIGSAVLGNTSKRSKSVDIDDIVFEGIYQLFLHDNTMTYARLGRIANNTKSFNSRQTSRFCNILKGKTDPALPIHVINNILKYIGKPYEEVFAPRKRSDA